MSQVILLGTKFHFRKGIEEYSSDSFFVSFVRLIRVRKSKSVI